MPDERLLRLCSCAGKLEMRTTQHWCPTHEALAGSLEVISWERMIETYGWDAGLTLAAQQALGSRLGLYTREFGRTARRSGDSLERFLPSDWRNDATVRSIGLEDAQPLVPWDQLDLGF